MNARAAALTAAIAAVAAVSCAPPGAGGASGEPAPTPGGSTRATDRVVIPAMTTITAIGVGDRYTFIATPGGLGIYDHRFNQWHPPVTRVDGWPDATVTLMLADPADPAAIWFAADNMVFHYRVGFDEIVRTLVPDRVNAFFVDPADIAGGVIVGSSTGYLRVSAAGGVQPYVQAPGAARPPTTGGSQRIFPQTVASVYKQYPALQGYERLITRDAQLRSWPVISAAATPGVSEVWLGTAGGGLFKADPLFFRGESVPFGLIGDGTGAVARAADGVWFGSLGGTAASRGGVTFVDAEFRTWRWLDGGTASPLANARITSLVQSGTTLWIGSDRGLVHLDAQTGGVLRRVDDMGASSVALALEVADGGVWVGTTRGLSFIPDSETSRSRNDVQTALLNTTVRALVMRSDTLWIASDLGLFALPRGESQPRRVRSAASDTRVNTAVTAIATVDSIVVIANAEGEVVRISARSGQVLDPVSLVNTSRVGRVYGLAADANTIWIAGERGVLISQRAANTQRFLANGPDLPGEAFGLVLTPRYAWIATRGGGVRVRRADDGMVR
ncbi:MAG TPA: hypothetical protein VE967_18675 [Gemmatimonadaceae bacterium]|nr:hypothetical protein [Gemmatimonadaceae bacterium]